MKGEREIFTNYLNLRDLVFYILQINNKWLALSIRHIENVSESLARAKLHTHFMPVL
jgi:hypothetical protein